jgi:hypothetical protein
LRRGFYHAGELKSTEKGAGCFTHKRKIDQLTLNVQRSNLQRFSINTGFSNI